MMRKANVPVFVKDKYIQLKQDIGQKRFYTALLGPFCKIFNVKQKFTRTKEVKGPAIPEIHVISILQTKTHQYMMMEKLFHDFKDNEQAGCGLERKLRVLQYG